ATAPVAGGAGTAGVGCTADVRAYSRNSHRCRYERDALARDLRGDDVCAAMAQETAEGRRHRKVLAVGRGKPSGLRARMGGIMARARPCGPAVMAAAARHTFPGRLRLFDRQWHALQDRAFSDVVPLAE